jgi:endonuclease/exonuclease/phosphatase family metal-dependent hydrolase
LKLLTWNIQWGRGCDGRVDLDRIVEHARRCADFDVLCLQEVSAGHDNLPGCDGADQFQQLAQRLPGFEPVFGVASDVRGPGSTPRRFGNLLLSRLPVLQVFNHLLPWPADDGVKSMQRVALEATLRTPLGLLRVTTTHLEYYSARQRAAQVDRLRELHAEASHQSRSNRPGQARHGPFEAVPRAGPAVLVGDFNFRPDDPEHGRLCAPIDPGTAAYVDAWTLAHPGRPHPPTVGVHDRTEYPGPPFACDFVFVSTDLASRVADLLVDESTDASDHQPVLLELA